MGQLKNLSHFDDLQIRKELKFPITYNFISRLISKMETMGVFQTLIILSISIASTIAKPASITNISLVGEISPDGIPRVEVTFADGFKDTLVLRRYSSNKKFTEVNCNFVGHLAKEKNALVAMTGCLGEEDVELTIQSVRASPSNSWIWTKEGNVEALISTSKVRHRRDVTNSFEDDAPIEAEYDAPIEAEYLFAIAELQNDDIR